MLYKYNTCQTLHVFCAHSEPRLLQDTLECFIGVQALQIVGSPDGLAEHEYVREGGVLRQAA